MILRAAEMWQAEGFAAALYYIEELKSDMLGLFSCLVFYKHLKMSCNTYTYMYMLYMCVCMGVVCVQLAIESSDIF